MKSVQLIKLPCYATKLNLDVITEELAGNDSIGGPTGSIEELITLADDTDCSKKYRDLKDDPIYDIFYRRNRIVTGIGNQVGNITHTLHRL